MNKRKTIKRPKALFGEAAAIVAQTAAQMITAAQQQRATERASQEQVRAINEQSSKQALALREQSQNDNALQQKMQDYTTQQNNENKDFQKTMQQNMLQAMGKDETNALKRQSLTQVRNGGHQNISHSSLRGRFNSPFVTTDGGGADYQFSTPEGYDLYEVKGDTHNEEHKLKTGGTATGVGFKFADGSRMEAEGAPKGKTGEYVLTTPGNVYFLSRHTIKGFNPVNAVKNGGMHPLTAFNIQENIKNRYGISNNDNRAEFGNDINLSNINVNQMPFIDNSQDIMKNGGRRSIRRCAGLGDWFKNPNNMGAVATGIGNIASAFMNITANNEASNRLHDAYLSASDRLQDAYRSMRGIDINSIDWNSYKPTHAIAEVRSANVDTTQERNMISRAEQRQLKNIGNNTFSSAAAQAKGNTVMTNAADANSRVFNQAKQIEENINQQNVQSINNINTFNAQLDSAANQRMLDQKMDILKYNNNLENTKIKGIADTANEGLLNSTQVRANNIQQNAGIWGSSIQGTTQGLTNAFLQNAKDKQLNKRTDTTNAANFALAMSNMSPEVYEKMKNDGTLDKIRAAMSFKFGGRKSLKRK